MLTKHLNEYVLASLLALLELLEAELPEELGELLAELGELVRFKSISVTLSDEVITELNSSIVSSESLDDEEVDEDDILKKVIIQSVI